VEQGDLDRVMFHGDLQNLEALNLNVCQNIADKGIEVIIGCGTELRIFSVYWNVRMAGSW